MSFDSSITLGDGSAINVRLEGLQGAPWLVLSNSVMTDLSVWDAQASALGAHMRILRYDQRGHGKSDVPNGPMTFDAYGADLLAVLDAFEVDRCTFVGLSMGTPTGLAAYSVQPDRFERFVVVDGVAKSAPGREAFWTERRETARARGIDAIARETAERWLPGEGEDDPAAVTALARMVAATPVEGFAAATHALQSYDYTAVVPRMLCPVLAIAGEKDGAMPAAIRSQFGAGVQVQFVEIAGAGHVPNLQRPAAFNGVLADFLGIHSLSDDRLH